MNTKVPNILKENKNAFKELNIVDGRDAREMKYKNIVYMNCKKKA